MDAQLGDDVDQPQKDYFVAIAAEMPEDSNIILCGPEPGWLYTLRQGESLGVIDYVGWQALNHCKNIQVPLVLSGDTHHYSRYVGTGDVEGKEFTTQFITSGGGGAFLHPTHQLKPTIDVNRKKDDILWLGGRAKTLTLASDPNPANGKPPKESCYPTRAESVAMLTGDFLFAACNPWFALVLGACYWLLGLIVVHHGRGGIYVTFAILFAGFWAYTKKQEGGGWKVLLVSAANAALHGAAVASLACFFSRLNAALPDWLNWPGFSWSLFGLEMIAAGGLVAGTLFGVYLYISSRWLNLNHNDAFSAMRRDSHRHFLRMRIKDDEVTIYPIALDRVPSRDKWRLNDKKTGSPAPVLISDPDLKPRLIEGPIVVRVPPRT